MIHSRNLIIVVRNSCSICDRRSFRRTEYSANGEPKVKFECLRPGMRSGEGNAARTAIKTIDTRFFLLLRFTIAEDEISIH